MAVTFILGLFESNTRSISLFNVDVIEPHLSRPNSIINLLLREITYLPVLLCIRIEKMFLDLHTDVTARDFQLRSLRNRKAEMEREIMREARRFRRSKSREVSRGCKTAVS